MEPTTAAPTSSTNKALLSSPAPARHGRAGRRPVRLDRHSRRRRHHPPRHRREQKVAAGQSARLTAGTASTTTTTVPITPPPSCPAATNPPGVPYQVAVKATLTAKLIDLWSRHWTQTPAVMHSHRVGPVRPACCCPVKRRPYCREHDLRQPDADQVPTGAAQPPIQDDDVDLSLAAPTLASVSPTPAANGGLNLTIKAQVQTLVYLGIPGPGVPACEDGPVNVTLTTSAPGGKPVTGPLQNATATLVASGFTIPPVTDTSGLARRCTPIYGPPINYRPEPAQRPHHDDRHRAHLGVGLKATSEKMARP